MGCDIHAHIEIQVNDEWHYYASVEFERNYDLFALMAGVRNYSAVTPIAQPRGLPQNSSFMTKMHENRIHTDAHTHSWLSSNEMDVLWEWIKEHTNQFEYRNTGQQFQEFGVWLFGNGLLNIKKYPGDYPKELQDVRIVFWFDN